MVLEVHGDPRAHVNGRRITSPRAHDLTRAAVRLIGAGRVLGFVLPRARARAVALGELAALRRDGELGWTILGYDRDTHRPIAVAIKHTRVVSRHTRKPNESRWS
jgi:hypothetical protein